MERLTIDEIIEHCKRKTEKYEYLNGANTLENADTAFKIGGIKGMEKIQNTLKERYQNE